MPNRTHRNENYLFEKFFFKLNPTVNGVLQTAPLKIATSKSLSFFKTIIMLIAAHNILTKLCTFEEVLKMFKICFYIK